MTVATTDTVAEVTGIESMALRRFEDCMSRLERLTKNADQPLSAMTNHPAVRSIIIEMRGLLQRAENGSADQLGMIMAVQANDSNVIAVDFTKPRTR